MFKLKLLSLILASSLTAETITLSPIEVNATQIETYPNTYETLSTKLFFQQTTPGSSSPVINGLQGDLIGIELEDIKINNSTFRSGPNQYFSWIPKEFANYNVKNGSSIGQTVDANLVASDSVTFEYTGYDNGKNLYASKKYNDTSVGVKYQTTGNYNGIGHTSYNQKAFFLKNESSNNEFVAMFSTSDDIDRLDKFQQNKVYTLLDQDYLLLKDRYTWNHSDYIGVNYQLFHEKINDNNTIIDSKNNVYGTNYTHYFNSGFDIHLNNSFEDLEYNKEFYKYNTFTSGIGYSGNLYGIEIKSNLDYVIADTSSETLSNHFNVWDYNLELQKGIVYGSYKYGFKLPTANNLYYANTSGKGIDIANSSLVPQTSNTYTLGIKDNGLFSYDLNAFYSQLSNSIDSVKISNGVYQTQNTGDGILKGLNGTITYSGYIRSILNAQYVYGVTDKDYMSKIIPFKLYFKNEYNHFFCTWNYARENTNMSKSDMSDIRIIGHNNGYNTVDVGYNNRYKQWDYTVLVNNIANNDGRVYGSSVDVPERSVTFKLAYMF
jgi:hypothetical protein